MMVGSYNNPGMLPHLKDQATITRLQALEPPLPGTDEGTLDEIRILNMICLPEEALPVQYGDQWSVDKTAVNKIIQRDSMSYQDQPENPENSTLKPTETFAAAFRGRGSMWARLRVHDPNKNNSQACYQLVDSETLQTDLTQSTIFPETSGQMNFNMAAVRKDVSSYAPHGDVMVCGRNFKTIPIGASWVWLDGYPNFTGITGSHFNIAFKSQAQIRAQCTFSFMRWNGGAPTDKVLVPAPITFDVNDPGWDGIDSTSVLIPDFYTIFYEQVGADSNDNTNGSNFTQSDPGVIITTNSFGSVLKQVKVDFAYQNVNQLGPGFMLAGSERFTDISPPFNMDGMSAVANTRTPGQWWQWYSSGASGQNNIFGPICNYKDAYGGPMRTGGYAIDVAHTAPDYAVEAFSDFDYTLGVLRDIFFDLEDTSLVNVFSAQVQNTGNNSGQTGIGAMVWYTLATQFTWGSDNKWVYQSPVDINALTWQAGMQLVRFVPRCMPNDTHRVDIFRHLFSRGKMFAKKHLAPLARVAIMAGGAAAGKALLNDLKTRPSHPWWVQKGAAAAEQVMNGIYGLQGPPVTLTLQGGGA